MGRGEPHLQIKRPPTSSALAENYQLFQRLRMAAAASPEYEDEIICWCSQSLALIQERQRNDPDLSITPSIG